MSHAKTKNRFCLSAIIAVTLATVLLAGTSHATDFTWDGYMTSSWGYSRNVGSVFVPQINSNWEPDGTSSLQLPTSADPVIFGEYTTSHRTVNLNGTRSVYSLEFKGTQDFNLTNGTLNLSSGNLSSPSTFAQTLDADITLQNSGTWDVSWAPVIVNGRIIGNANLTKTGVGPLYLTNDDNLLVDTYINEGSFKIKDGGSLSNSDSYIGNTAGTLGTAYVTGENSTWTNTEGIRVGSLGRGTLGITQGGTVTSRYGSIGESTGSNGTVSVYGSDSAWNTGALFIGDWGQGVLNIRDGSSVTSSSISVGTHAGSTGTVTVADANSTWNSGSIYLGWDGESTLNIENGGTVESDGWTYIGYIGTSTNIATVTGANSTWDVSGKISVGYWASGILNIEDGGTVTSNTGQIGEVALDYGVGIVSVAGINSTWNISDYLTVGDFDGSGEISTYEATLNIETGGTVSVGNQIRIRNSGKVNILGGTLRAANFEFEDRSLNFDAGTLHLTQNTVINSSNIYDLDVKNLDSGKTLRVDGITTLQTPLTLNGGKLSTDSIVGFNNLDHQSGTFELTQSDFTIGSAGIAGPNVSIPKGAIIDVTNNAGIAVDGVLNLSGGVFSAARLTNNGTIIASGNTASYFGTGDPGKELVHNGLEIRTTAGSRLTLIGPVSGSGDFTGPGDVYFMTDYSPGNSTDIINFEGDAHFYGFGDNNGYGNLNIELAGLLPGEFDQLVIAGDASIDGYLAIELLDGFLLSPNDEFEILDVAGTLSGQFVGLGERDLVGNFDGEDLFISYTAGDGNDVSLFTTGNSGDFDSDGDIDGFDFLNLQRDFGNTFNNDLADWEANFGTTSDPVYRFAASAVPEPSTILLGLLASLIGISCRCH